MILRRTVNYPGLTLAMGLPASTLVVGSKADLPAASGGEHVLPGRTVLMGGAINLEGDALRMSTDTVLLGIEGTSIMSAATGGVVRATNVGSAVIMRKFNIIALAGPCLNLAGSTAHQLNMSFVGLIGAGPGTSGGTISGFDVQAAKDCFINAPDGLRITGVTNKSFLSACPFYGIAPGNAAVTLDAALVAKRLDYVTNFFKGSPDSIALRADAGYSLELGRVRGSMLEGPTIPLDGIHPADINWWFKANDKIADSRVAAQAYLTEPATTPITQIGEFVPVTGPFVTTPLTQRFIRNAQDELVYVGFDPVLISFRSVFSVNPSSNDRLAFQARKNDELRPESNFFVEQGQGAGSFPRTGGIDTLIDLEYGDRVGLSVANLTAVAGVPWLSATYSVVA